ncbi:MAG: hypothetical protein H7X86_02965 [Gorillibacterium sp.]|nr:hypothetical protein [Gorillibacterium sp.]
MKLIAKKSRHPVGKKKTKRRRIHKILVPKKARRHHKSGITKQRLSKASIGKKSRRSKGIAKRKRRRDFRVPVVSKGLNNRIFHLPRFEGEINEEESAWDIIHSALPQAYMMPDVEVVRKMESYLPMDKEIE